MALLVDTCGWIEWLTDDTLAESFRPYLEKIDRLVVPTAIQFELYKWVCRERDSTQALRVIALTEQGRVIPLSTALALYAAELAIEHKLSFADAIIRASFHRILGRRDREDLVEDARDRLMRWLAWSATSPASQ